MKREDKLCVEVIDMIESALACAKLSFISDEIHKDGLIATLEDIVTLIKKDEH